jgi:hypothetical protein
MQEKSQEYEVRLSFSYGTNHFRFPGVRAPSQLSSPVQPVAPALWQLVQKPTLAPFELFLLFAGIWMVRILHMHLGSLFILLVEEDPPSEKLDAFENGENWQVKGSEDGTVFRTPYISFSHGESDVAVAVAFAVAVGGDDERLRRTCWLEKKNVSQTLLDLCRNKRAVSGSKH